MVIWKGCISMDIETFYYCEICDKKLNEDQCYTLKDGDQLVCINCLGDYEIMDNILTDAENGKNVWR